MTWICDCDEYWCDPYALQSITFSQLRIQYVQQNHLLRSHVHKFYRTFANKFNSVSAVAAVALFSFLLFQFSALAIITAPLTCVMKAINQSAHPQICTKARTNVLISFKSQKLHYVDDVDVEHIICSLKVSTLFVGRRRSKKRNGWIKNALFSLHRSLNQ